MKIAALILGIFGGLIAAGLGIKWISDAHDMQGQIALLQAAGVNLAELDSLIRAGYLLVVAFPLAIAGGVLTMMGKGKIGAAVLAVAAIAPAIFAAKSLVATFFILLAALFAALAKPKQATSQLAPQPA